MTSGCAAPSPMPSIARPSLTRCSSRASRRQPLRGVPEWSPRIDDLGAGAKYYQYDPSEAKRLLADAGFPQGFTTQLWTTPGLGPALLDATQLVQRDLKEVGITAALKIQEFGAYI